MSRLRISVTLGVVMLVIRLSMPTLAVSDTEGVDQPGLCPVGSQVKPEPLKRIVAVVIVRSASALWP